MLGWAFTHKNCIGLMAGVGFGDALHLGQRHAYSIILVRLQKIANFCISVSSRVSDVN